MFKGIILLISIILISTSCKIEGEIKQLTPLEAYGQYTNRFAIIIDVREEAIIKSSGGLTAKPAIWIPLSQIIEKHELWNKFTNENSRNKLLVFYCRTGKSAHMATMHAIKHGFNATNIGTFTDWILNKLPTKKFIKGDTP